MKIVVLFIASLMANLKLLLITAFGTVLALQRFNILNDQATKHINIISFYAFNPALIVSNLAETMTHKSVDMLWFMPVNVLISFIIGSMLGWILLKIVKVSHTLTPLVLASCAAGNIGTMLQVIVPSLCQEKGSPFGAVDACNAEAMAYASLSRTIGEIYLWLYVYNIVRIAANKNIANEDSSKSFSNNIISESCNGQMPPSSSDDAILRQLEAAYQQPHSTATCTSPKHKAPKLVEQITFHMKDIAVKYLNLKALFAPSTIGAVVGLIIGIIPPFRKAFIGARAPLYVLQDSASLLGGASVPSIVLIVGANLLKGLKKSDLKVYDLILIMVVRYMLLPIIGIAIVKGALHFGLIPSDPLYHFVLLLQYSVPPAINIATITQLFGIGEKECSVIFLVTYVAAPAALTLWSTFFLWLVQM